MVDGTVIGALSSWLAVTRRTVIVLWSEDIGSYLIYLSKLNSKSIIITSLEWLVLVGKWLLGVVLKISR